MELYALDTQTTLCTFEHFMTTHVDWDPTGRYLTTSVSYWQQKMENGYTIWSLQGQPLDQLTKEKFYQFLWRPRPPTLLSDEELQTIERNLKSYSKQFDADDHAMKNAQGQAMDDERRALIEAWQIIKQRLETTLESHHASRQSLGFPNYRFDDQESNDDWIEVAMPHRELIEQVETSLE